VSDIISSEVFTTPVEWKAESREDLAMERKERNNYIKLKCLIT